MVAAIERVEGGVRQPGLIEVEIVDITVEQASLERPVELQGRDLVRAVREKRGVPVAISRGSEL